MAPDGYGRSWTTRLGHLTVTSGGVSHKAGIWRAGGTGFWPGGPWVDGSWTTAHAGGSGHVYPNFPDPALDDWAAAYHAGNHPRLAAVKNAYDPHRFFDFPQAV